MDITELKSHSRFKTIRHLYHISDIHISNDSKREEEYKLVFDNLFKLLKEDMKARKNSLIVIGGDVVHEYDKHNNVQMDLFNYLFLNLNMICEVIIILGNHDCSKKEQELDSLSALFKDKSYMKNIHFLKDTGHYGFKNLLFSVTSVLPKPTDGKYKILKSPKTERTTIGLFHGEIRGSTLFNGISLGDRGALLDNFNQDYVLLGDNHKYQYLRENVAYSGSLLQRNHGETIKNHGILRWDLKTNNHKLLEVENDYCYLTLTIRDGKYELPKNLKKNMRLKIRYLNTNKKDLDKIEQYINEKYNVIESSSSLLYEEQKINNVSEDLLLDTMNIKYQNKYIKEELITKQEIDNKITDEMITSVLDMNSEINKKLDKENKINFCSIKWKLLKLEFDNIFCYDEGNVIDFTKAKGITLIFANNGWGKTSILDAILFCLFKKTSKDCNIDDIMNKKKNKFSIDLYYEYGNRQYCIRRAGRKSDKNRTNLLFEIKNGEKHKLCDRDDSINAEIRRCFGDYKDFILTTMSLQHNNENISEYNPAPFKSEINKLLRLNIFEKLSDLAIKEKNKIDKRYDELDGESVGMIINNLFKDNKNNKFKYNKLKKQTKIINDKLGKLRNKKSEYEKEYVKINERELKNNKNKIKDEDYELLNKNRNKILSNLNNQDQVGDSNEIIERNTKFETEKHNKLKGLNEQRDVLLTSRKSVKNVKINIESENKKYQQNIEQLSNLNLDELMSDKANLLKQVKKINIGEMNKEIEKMENKKNKLKIHKLDEDKYEFNKKYGTITKKDIDKIQKLEKLNIELLIKQETIEKNLEKYKYDFNPDCKSCRKNIKLFDQEIINFKTELKDIKSQIQEIQFSSLELYEVYRANNEYKKLSNENIVNNKKLEEINIKLNVKKQERQEYYDNINIFEEIQGLNTQIIKMKDDKLKIEKQNQEILFLIENQNNLDINKELDEKIDIINKKIKEALNTQNLEYLKYMEYNNLKIQLSDVETKLTIFNEVLKIKEVRENNERLSSKIEILEKHIQQNEQENHVNDKECGKLEANLENNEKQIKQLKLNLNECKDLSKKQKLYNLYVPLMGKDGIRKIIIQKILPQIEKNTNQILNNFVNFQLNLSVNSAGNISMNVSKDNIIYKISNLSGYEKFVVDISLRITLNELSNLSKPNFISIDEGFSCSSSENLSKIDTLFNFLRDRYSFVLIVTHLEQLQDKVDTLMKITRKNKEKGPSKIIFI